MAHSFYLLESTKEYGLPLLPLILSYILGCFI